MLGGEASPMTVGSLECSLGDEHPTVWPSSRYTRTGRRQPGLASNDETGFLRIDKSSGTGSLALFVRIVPGNCADKATAESFPKKLTFRSRTLRYVYLRQ